MLKFLKWRKMTWTILVWSGLFVWWIFSATGDRPSKDCIHDPDVLNGTISLDLCQDASDVGTGLGVSLIIMLWFFGFFILSIVWFMSRPRQQEVIVVERRVPSTEG